MKALLLLALFVTLAWADHSDKEAGFRMERRKQAAGEVWKKIGEVGQNVTQFTDTSTLSTGRHCYRVRAFAGKQVSAPSNVICINK